MPGFQQQIPLQVEQASAHRGGGFPQVVLLDRGHAPCQVEVITPRDRRHARAAAAVSLIGINPSDGGFVLQAIRPR